MTPAKQLPMFAPLETSEARAAEKIVDVGPNGGENLAMSAARNLVFVAPFPSDVTMRFVRAASKLENTRLLGVVHSPPKGKDANVYDDKVRIQNPLSTSDIIACVEELKKRHGKIHRIIGILEAQQVQLGQVREHFGVDRMVKAVFDNRHKPAREIVDLLLKAARKFAGTNPQRDDMTAVIVKVGKA